MIPQTRRKCQQKSPQVPRTQPFRRKRLTRVIRRRGDANPRLPKACGFESVPAFCRALPRREDKECVRDAEEPKPRHVGRLGSEFQRAVVLPSSRCCTVICEPVLPGAGYHHQVPTCAKPRSVLPLVVSTVRLKVLANDTRLLSRLPK